MLSRGPFHSPLKKTNSFLIPYSHNPPITSSSPLLLKTLKETNSQYVVFRIKVFLNQSVIQASPAPGCTSPPGFPSFSLVCQETGVRSLSWEDPLEKGMATHSSILAWRIPCTDKSDRLQPMGLQSWTRLSTFHYHYYQSGLSQ